MRIQFIKKNIEYLRIIEGMGKGLVLFKVQVKEKAVGQNLHYYYEDKRKPPLDLAVNPNTNMVEYISIFAQDEIISKSELTNKVTLLENNIEFICDDLSEKYPDKRESAEFLIVMDDKTFM